MKSPIILRARQPRSKQRTAGYVGAFVLVLALAAPGAEVASARLIGSRVDTKLLGAAQQGSWLLLQEALAEGADVNCRGTNGLPPLLEIFRTATRPLDAGRRRCISYLLKHGAMVDVLDPDRRTPLMLAARLGDLETMRLLVDAQAYVMMRDRFHKSALFYAVEARRRDIVLYLAANGDLISLSVKERKQFNLPR